MGSSWSRLTHSVTITKQNNKTVLKWPQRFSEQNKHLLRLSEPKKILSANGFDIFEIQENDIPFYDSLVSDYDLREKFKSGFKPHRLNKCFIYQLNYHDAFPIWLLSGSLQSIFEEKVFLYVKRIVNRGDIIIIEVQLNYTYYVVDHNRLVRVPDPIEYNVVYPLGFSLPEYPINYWSDGIEHGHEIGIDPSLYTSVLEIEEVKVWKYQHQHKLINSKFILKGRVHDFGTHIGREQTKPLTFYNLYAISDSPRSLLTLYLYTNSGYKTIQQIYKAFLLAEVVVSLVDETTNDLCLSYDSVMTSKKFSQYKKKQEPRVHQILNSNILIQDVLKIVCEYDHIVF